MINWFGECKLRLNHLSAFFSDVIEHLGEGSSDISVANRATESVDVVVEFILQFESARITIGRIRSEAIFRRCVAAQRQFELQDFAYWEVRGLELF